MGLAFMLASACLGGSTDIALIDQLRAERGILGGPITVAQVSLARWMLGERGGEFARSNLIDGLSDDQVTRYLTGEVEPDYGVARLIAEKTKGAVTEPMWAKFWTERPDKMSEAAEATASVADGVADRLPLPGRQPHFPIPLTEVSDADFGAMLIRGDLVIVGPDNVMRVPAASFRPLMNQMGPLLSVVERGAPG
jgi:hypothetical protein